MMNTQQFLRQIFCMACMMATLSACVGLSPAAPAALPPSATPLPPTMTPQIPTATVQVQTAAPAPSAAPQTWETRDYGRIQFQPNATGWHTPGSLLPGTAVRFVLSAMRGQQMTVRLETEPASSQEPLAALHITGADGQVFTPNPVTYWSGILLSSQDYWIEIRSLAREEINYSMRVEIPAAAIDPALGDRYDLPPLSVCQAIQELAAQGTGLDFFLESRAPFLDAVAGEAGQGCRLSARANGNNFTDPRSAVAALAASAGLGWTEQPAYQADGPTGSATALARDMALMLIDVHWTPEMDVLCPADRPISECSLTPEQKIYFLRIDVALYRADFSLDGHWEDASTGFSLDLYQDWKSIYGRHTAVAQGGNKIDALDVSIQGSLKGNEVELQFQSSFTDKPGTARITYVDVNTITWEIITPPEGEFYLPAQATLIRR